MYDTWAKDLQFRYVQGVAAKVHPVLTTLQVCFRIVTGSKAMVEFRMHKQAQLTGM